MSPIIPSRYGHPKYNSFPQKSRATSLGGIKGVSQRGTPGSDSKSRRKQRLEDNKITVQPTEDEEADNFYSKHLAAARFQRNHKLINVLFNDTVVDQEQNAENERLHVSRQKRIKNLEEYKDRVGTEISELEERFVAKRAKITEDGKKFNESLRDYIERSKKEIATLKAAQEVRRQKELLIRQQTPKQSSPTPTSVATTATTLSAPGSTSNVTTSISSKTTFSTPQANNSSNHVNGTDLHINNNSSEIDSLNKKSTNQNGVIPMEIEQSSNTHDKTDVQSVLNDIISSVAKIV